MSEDLKAPTLTGLGIDQGAMEELVDQMARNPLASGSPGKNPREAAKDEIVERYRKAL